MFCGVHFMAESADVLTGDHQTVILPDLNAGCSMADMADLDEVEEAWEALAEVTDIERVIPITYMNSSAALKAFVGRNGGAVCTSTNARAVLDWALGKGPAGLASVGATGGGDKVLFFPDQHLGRNTGLAMGYDARRHAGVEPAARAGRPHRGRLQGGHASSCGRATARCTSGSCPSTSRPSARSTPTASSSTHPECRYDTCQMADHVGSTDFIIRTVERGAGRLRDRRGHRDPPREPAERRDPRQDRSSRSTRSSAPARRCSASTPPHLCWVLENLVEGEVVNQITVDPDTTEWAKVALQRMLEIV